MLMDIGAITKAPCGCTVGPRGPARVLKSLQKCRQHWARYRDPAELDAAYYQELGVLTSDNRLCEGLPHLAEWVEAVGHLPLVSGPCVELGCGISPYVTYLSERADEYVGVDICPWAISLMSALYPGETFVVRDLACQSMPRVDCGLIFAAHVLEHMPSADRTIADIAWSLSPGGYAAIIVPDATDLANPDHLWFFTEETLVASLRHVGLEVEQVAIRKRVSHENFIYALARRPKCQP